MAKSYAGSFAGIDYQELIGSGAMEYRIDGAWAERRFRVAWKYRIPFVHAMFVLPGASGASAAKCFRQFPDDRRLEANRVRVEPLYNGKEGSSSTTRSSDLLSENLITDMPMGTYTHADVIVTYGKRRTADERWGVQFAVGSEARPAGTFQYLDETKIEEPLSVNTRTAEITYTFGTWEIKSDKCEVNTNILSMENIKNAIGTVAAGPLTYTDCPQLYSLLGIQKGDSEYLCKPVLFYGCSVAPVCYCGEEARSFTYRFRWNPNGWNQIYRKSTGAYAVVTDSGGVLGGKSRYETCDYFATMNPKTSIIPEFDTDFP